MYSGRDADASAKAARDPQRTHHMYRNLAVPAEVCERSANSPSNLPIKNQPLRNRSSPPAASSARLVGGFAPLTTKLTAGKRRNVGVSEGLLSQSFAQAARPNRPSMLASLSADVLLI